MGGGFPGGLGRAAIPQQTVVLSLQPGPASLQRSPPACGVCPAEGSREAQCSWAKEHVSHAFCSLERPYCVWTAGRQALSPSWYKRPAQGHTALRLVRSGQPGDRRPKHNCWQVADEPTCLPDRLAVDSLAQAAPLTAVPSTYPRPCSVDGSEDRTGRGSCWKGRLWGLDLGGSACVRWSLQPAVVGGTGGTHQSRDSVAGNWEGHRCLPSSHVGAGRGLAQWSVGRGPVLPPGSSHTDWKTMMVTRERGGGPKPITSRPAGVAPRPCRGEGPRQVEGGAWM